MVENDLIWNGGMALDKTKSGSKGGISCKLRQGTDYIPFILMAGSYSQLLQIPIEIDYFSIQGSKGGNSTFNKYGHNHMSRIGKMGGRGNKRS